MDPLLLHGQYSLAGSQTTCNLPWLKLSVALGYAARV